MAMSRSFVPSITVVDTSVEDGGNIDSRITTLCNVLTEGKNEPLSENEFKECFSRQTFTDNLFHLLDFLSDELIHRDTLVATFRTCFWDSKKKRFVDELVSQIRNLGTEEFRKEDLSKLFNVDSVRQAAFESVDVSGSGVVTFREIMEFLAHLTDARPRSGLTQEELQHVQRVFREATRGQEEINLEDFRKIIKSRNNFFTERVFHVFDRDNSGLVSLQEFLDAIEKLVGQSPDEKINFLFKIYDLDSDGFIQHSELRHVMRACMEENGMKFSEEQIDDLTTALFEDADPYNTGAITFNALKAQLAKHDGLLENLSSSIERWLVPPRPEPPLTWTARLQKLLPHWARWRYVKNNHVYLGFLSIFLFVNLVLFITRAVQYSDQNSFVILARACGQCLNFTCVMVLVFMLRNCITWLRSHGFSSLLPLDDHIFFHKLTGCMIVGFSSIHTIMHLCNYNHLATLPPELNTNLTFSEYLFTPKSGQGGLVPGCASITGVLLVIVFAVMALCSLRCVRKSGKFQVFYWTHQLYVVFWFLLIFHGPSFWKWFVFPAAIYIIERIVRGIRLATRHGKTFITEGVLLPSKVTHLVIKRPPHFDFCPGDYIFVRIPTIARSEWHPFTLSSAPEQEDFIWLHIRAVGEWTNRLHEFVQSQRQKMTKLDAIEDDVVMKGKLDENGSKSVKISKEVPKKSVRIEIGHENITLESDTESFSPINLRVRPLHKTLTASKSMPDVAERFKSRERRMIKREIPRSASEKSFDEKLLRKARGTLNSTLYRRNRSSMAQSFKYVRNKPNIVPLSPIVDHNSDEEESEEKSEFIGTVATTPINARKESMTGTKIMGKPLEIHLDGPFGAPSSHIFRAQHAVLIATGIGVTPFASILQAIMRRYWKEQHICPRCNHAWTGQVPRSVMNLRKVDFFWINRDQRSFEWFVNLLSQLEIEQAELGGAMERFLDMHMYITSALQRADMKALGLQLALDLLHEREKRDLITGLKTRTQAGRPNWTKVFKQISDQRKGKITVFYCGPPELGRTLQVKCDEFGFTFRKEVF